MSEGLVYLGNELAYDEAALRSRKKHRKKSETHVSAQNERGQDILLISSEHDGRANDGGSAHDLERTAHKALRR